GFNGLLASQALAELVAGLIALFVMLGQLDDLKGMRTRSAGDRVEAKSWRERGDHFGSAQDCG
ncbi:MAG: hypothetical protein E5W25_32755, partial [Mesorhizobium sp.]